MKPKILNFGQRFFLATFVAAACQLAIPAPVYASGGAAFCSVNSGWGIAVQLPLLNRAHIHVYNTPVTGLEIEAWNYSELIGRHAAYRPLSAGV